MRRADRLFEIVTELRRRPVTTARQLAERLEVSERTIYRDMQDLSLSGVPVLGSPGSGYSLHPGYFLPPITFRPDELEALVLGAEMVAAGADEELARAAAAALERIRATLPDRRGAEPGPVLLSLARVSPVTRRYLGPLRGAVRSATKVRIAYRREDGTPSERCIWPLALVFWGKVWTLGAYCELRQDFRDFRVDRISDLALTDETFAAERADLLARYQAQFPPEFPPD